MTIDFLLDGAERLRRIRPVLREHVEADLRVVQIFWQGLEGEQAHGLFLQLVDAGLAALADRLEDQDYRLANLRSFLELGQEQRKGGGSRMRDDLDRTWRIRVGRIDDGRA